MYILVFIENGFAKLCENLFLEMHIKDVKSLPHRTQFRCRFTLSFGFCQEIRATAKVSYSGKVLDHPKVGILVDFMWFDGLSVIFCMVVYFIARSGMG